MTVRVSGLAGAALHSVRGVTTMRAVLEDFSTLALRSARRLRAGCRATPLYNMGGRNTIRVLYFGLDTLEVSYMGSVKREAEAGLNDAKQAAREAGHPFPYRFGSEVLGVQRAGLKPFSWVATCPDYHLRLGRNGVGASVRVLSLSLAAVGGQDTLLRALAAASSVGSFGGGVVSRVDVCCDFQGWVPTLAAMRGVVCRASFRPVYPSTEAPETWQYGQGDIVVRVYNKSVEARKKGSHWPAYWRRVAGFDPDQDVWRVEVQLRSGFLRDRGLRRVEDVLANIPSLWAAGLAWCSLRRPTTDSHRDRWPLHGVWSRLLGLAGESVPLPCIRDDADTASAASLIPQLAGLLVSYAARSGLHEPDEVLARFLRGMGEYHAERGTYFQQEVQRRQMALYGVEVCNGLPPAWACLGL